MRNYVSQQFLGRFRAHLTLSWWMLLSYRNQSIDLLCNQWTGFYMIPASIMKGLNQTKTELSAKKVRLLGHLSSVQRLMISNWIPISPLGFIPSTKKVEAALPPEVFSGNSTPKTCSKPIVEHPRQSAISLKLLCNFVEILFRHRHLPCRFTAHPSRVPSPNNTSRWLLPKKMRI